MYTKENVVLLCLFFCIDVSSYAASPDQPYSEYLPDLSIAKVYKMVQTPQIEELYYLLQREPDVRETVKRIAQSKDYKKLEPASVAYSMLWRWMFHINDKIPSPEGKAAVTKQWQIVFRGGGIPRLVILEFLNNDFEGSLLTPEVWKTVEESKDALLWNRFSCAMVSMPTRENVERLEDLIRHLDRNIPGNQETISNVSHALTYMNYALLPDNNPQYPGPAMGPPTRVSFEKGMNLASLTLLSTQESQRIKELPQQRKNLLERAKRQSSERVKTEEGRTQLLIAIMSNPDSALKEIAYTSVNQYYLSCYSPEAENYASEKEVGVMREMIRSEDFSIREKCMVLIRNSQSVMLVPFLMDLIKNREIMEDNEKNRNLYEAVLAFLMGPFVSEKTNENVNHFLCQLAAEKSLPTVGQKILDSTIHSIEGRYSASPISNKNSIAPAYANIENSPFYRADLEQKYLPLCSETPSQDYSRIWKSSDSHFMEDCVLLGVADDFVRLLRVRDDVELTIPIRRLSLDDQKYLRSPKANADMRENLKRLKREKAEK